MINECEIFEITNVFGKTKNDPGMTDDIWDSRYAKYDVDGDERITQNDINIVRYHINTSKFSNGHIVQFKTAGKYLLRYNSCPGGGVVGYIDSNSQTPYVWRNDSFNNQISTQLPDHYNDITYDYINDMFFFTNKFEKNIHAIIFDNQGNEADKTKYFTNRIIF